MRVPPRTSVQLHVHALELVAAPQQQGSESLRLPLGPAERATARGAPMTLELLAEVAQLREENAQLREQLASERARRAEQLSSVADTLERASETVREMAREA